ncbi:MAG: hypothetical protein GY906_01620 [bacterium]|nr:hypothetical protein [bacterium]
MKILGSGQPTSQAVKVEADGYSLSAIPVWVGSDLVVVIGGGSHPHVGCVVIAQPVKDEVDDSMRLPSVSVVTIPPHKEEPIARAVSMRLAQDFNCVVVASAGVHEDGLSLSGIETYLALGHKLADRLSIHLSEDSA